MKRCNEFRLLLSPWFDQELSDEVYAEVDAHLSSCSTCSAEVEALRTIDLLLVEPYVSQLDEADLSDRVLSEIRSRRPGLSWWLRTAAAVIVSVGFGLAAGGVMTRDDTIEQDSTQSEVVLAMIENHFGDNAQNGIGDLARDLERGGQQ